MIYNIHHLHCGSLPCLCAPIWSKRLESTSRLAIALLIETDRGLVLIDTGLGTQDYLHTEQRLGSLLTQLGSIRAQPQIKCHRTNSKN